MYKHDIHKAMTYMIFVMFTVVILLCTVPLSFKVNEYTYMITLLFSSTGAMLYSEVYLGVKQSVKEKGKWVVIFRNIFILPFFFVNCSLVLLFIWFLVSNDVLNSYYYIYYTFVGGFTWLISYQISKIFPNIPSMVFSKKEQ
ncbi:hypothetical protein [Cytobacillus massiliigabonensis]|uniref:hypothetical protein n=1 Tax=Cytobacillus massiliigabonensis TaxID=1871011 RepID=UPI000C84481A|nr:hypothetical protein [Cytobacillus massiliigabonensis]